MFCKLPVIRQITEVSYYDNDPSFTSIFKSHFSAKFLVDCKDGFGFLCSPPSWNFQVEKSILSSAASQAARCPKCFPGFKGHISKLGSVPEPGSCRPTRNPVERGLGLCSKHLRHQGLSLSWLRPLLLCATETTHIVGRGFFLSCLLKGQGILQVLHLIPGYRLFQRLALIEAPVPQLGAGLCSLCRPRSLASVCPPPCSHCQAWLWPSPLRSLSESQADVSPSPHFRGKSVPALIPRKF